MGKRLEYASHETRAYFQMHLMIEPEIQDIDWGVVLYYAEASSMLDYYMDYCKVCSYLISEEDTSKEVKKYVKKLLREMRKVIPGSMLDKLVFDGDDFVFCPKEETIQEIGAAYTEGDMDG